MSTVARLSVPGPEELLQKGSGKPSSTEPAFDPTALLARFGGDETFVREMIGLFLEESVERLEGVRAAARDGDAQRLRLAAHAVRGLIANFSTGPAYRAASRLEECGRDGDLAGAARVHASLEEALAVLRSALAAFAQELAK
jgi:HPt (histidine-containing phosphotransfer) domain-containing protein